MLDDFVSVMREKNITVTYTEKVVSKLAEISVGAKAGARELRTNIRKFIEDKAVDIIIENCERTLSSLEFDYENEFKVGFK